MKIDASSEYRDLDIAVTGMAGRFPGATDRDEFWTNISQGRESLTWLTDNDLKRAGVDEERIQDPHYVKAAFKLDGIANFDAAFFGFTPKEAALMDPQLRLLLETSWHALEDSGCAIDAYGGRVGVFVGASTSQYLMRNILSNYGSERIDEMRTIWIGNDLNYLATMLSYKLNLTGPSINVQSACSTSLTTVAMACQSLLNYECDMALAGGCKIAVPQEVGYTYTPGEIVSIDGHCRPFDSRGSGTVLGSGLGMVVLKRLKDAVQDHDQIISVIKGSAVNNDGSSKVGYTAPSISGESRVIRDAQILSEVEADTITYIETHGTATELGDPIEIQALTEAFEPFTDKKQFCALGAVKANIGHLDTASGIAGLIKTCLVLKNGMIPPVIHYEVSNKNIDFASTPFYVPTQLSKWKPDCGVRRAGVSSFGFGGTNVHVVLEEALESRTTHSHRVGQLLLLSGKSRRAVEQTASNLATFLKNNADVDYRNAIYTMGKGRKQFDYRSHLVCESREELIAKLEKAPECVRSMEGSSSGVVFMFPGQGVQYIGMAKELYETEGVFREEAVRCASILKELIHYDLIDFLFHSNGNEENQQFISETQNTHVAMFVIEYATAKLLMNWGIVPAAMIGHSIGEYVAACLSGVMDLKTTLRLVAERGRIIQSLAKGSMLSVHMSAEEAMKYCGDHISLAVDNTDTLSVLSGETDEILLLAEALDENTPSRILHTSHAFHSFMMREGEEAFRNVLKTVDFHSPNIPYISNVTGDWVGLEDVSDPEYWISHMTGTVKFREGTLKLKDNNFRFFFEIGPGNTLSTFMRQNLKDTESISIWSTIQDANHAGGDSTYLLNTLGKAWTLGLRFDINAFYEAEDLYKISVPGYPFHSTPYWINARLTGQKPAPNVPLEEKASEDELPEDRTDLSTSYIPPDNDLEKILKEILEEVMGIRSIGVTDNFIELGGHSLIAAQVISRIRDMFGLEISLKQFMDNPTIREVADTIFDELASLSEDEESNSLV
ncbi:type I polyketide synthase [Paenibacillus polymyxa]|uniref:type I polyketide synthase n=1 Tax=Paenibacillus polymyxa TaxID=1406 RepID=UPI0032174375